MILQLLIIVAMGATLVWLQRSDRATDAADTLPDDVWAAFYDAASQAGTPAVDRTLSTMAVGARGWIDIGATAVDLGGTLWLFRHAPVHQQPGAERIEVRRDADGYHLAQHDTGIALLDDRVGNRLARVRVTGRF